jgi:hypothetical protein
MTRLDLPDFGIAACSWQGLGLWRMKFLPWPEMKCFGLRSSMKKPLSDPVR